MGPKLRCFVCGSASREPADVFTADEQRDMLSDELPAEDDRDVSLGNVCDYEAINYRTVNSGAAASNMIQRLIRGNESSNYPRVPHHPYPITQAYSP